MTTILTPAEDDSTFGLREDESLAARMALETPQVMVRWNYAPALPTTITSIDIQRSTYRFPESTSEGDSVYSVTPDMADLPSSYADTSVEDLQMYYYSLFFTYRGPFATTVSFEYDVRRLGELQSALFADIGRAWWVLARDETGTQVIWLYDGRRELATERIDISAVVGSDRGVAIAKYSESGSDRTFGVATNQQYVEFTIADTATEVLVDDISIQFDYIDIFSPGFSITGAGYLATRVLFLDAANEEVLAVSVSTPSVSDTIDLSGFILPGDFRGVSYDTDSDILMIGCGKVVYGFDWPVPASPDNQDITYIFPVRYTLDADFSSDDQSGTFSVLSRSQDNLISYDLDDRGGDFQVEEQTPPISNIYGLWRLNEETGSSFADESGNGYTATGTGTVAGAEGKFGNSSQLLDEDSSIDLIAAASSFNPNLGLVQLWWRRPYEGYSPVSNRYLAWFQVNGSNHLRIYFTATGTLVVRFTRGGTVNTWTSTSVYPLVDDGLFHNIAVRWVASSLRVYLDGVEIGSPLTYSGTWAGTLNEMFIGGTSTNTLYGFYDEIVLTGTSVSPFSRYSLTTLANRAWALSGRDYTVEAQHWKDKLLLEFDEYIVRNDFEVIALPEDKELADTEVIFRDDKADMTLGQLGRLCRFFGLLLDRVTDYRKFFMNHLNSMQVEYEFIEKLGELIRADDVDPEWNVDQRRQFLEVMYFSYQRGGCFEAFQRMARFLGFRLYEPDALDTVLQHGRRFFDSVRDPVRPDVPFDTLYFDSGADDVALVTLQYRLFKENRRAAAGATSVPATRQFTDTGGAFLSQAEPGSLLIINDQSTGGDNGQYIVDSVTNNTTLVVDRDWPAGSLSSLQYRLHWKVPVPDPYTDQVISRFLQFKARWQDLIFVTG